MLVTKYTSREGGEWGHVIIPSLHRISATECFKNRNANKCWIFYRYFMVYYLYKDYKHWLDGLPKAQLSVNTAEFILEYR